MKVIIRITATICALIGSRVAAKHVFSGGPLLASLTEQADSAGLGLGIEVSFDGIPRGSETTRDELLNVSQAGASYATGESCMLSGDYTCAIFSFIFRHRTAEAALSAAATAESEGGRSTANSIASVIGSVDRPSAYESALASANLAFVLSSKNRLFMLSFESVHIFKRSRRLLRRCLELCDIGLAPLEGHPAPWLRFAAKISENPNAVAQGKALRNKCAETLTPFLWEAQTPTIDEPTEPLGTIMPWDVTMVSEQEINGTHDRQASGTFALLLALYGEHKSAVNHLEVLCDNKPSLGNVEISQYSDDDACEALLVVKRLGIAHNFLELGINGPTPFEKEEIRAPKFVDKEFSDKLSTDPENHVASCSSGDCRSSAFAIRSSSSSSSSNNIRRGGSSDARYKGSSNTTANENESTSSNFPRPNLGLFFLRSSSSRRFVEDHRTVALTIRLANRRNPRAMANCRLHVLAHGSLFRTANHSLPRNEGSPPPVAASSLSTSVGAASTRASKRDSSANVNATLELVNAAEARLSKWWREALGPEARWLLGGVQVLSMGRLPFRPADLNYLRKVPTQETE